MGEGFYACCNFGFATGVHSYRIVSTSGIIAIEDAAAAVKTAPRTRGLPMTRRFDEDIRVPSNKGLKDDKDKIIGQQ